MSKNRVAGDGPAIEARGLVKVYGDTRAVDGIDLTVRRGQVFGFLGPNGAGKTTAMSLGVAVLMPLTFASNPPEEDHRRKDVSHDGAHVRRSGC